MGHGPAEECLIQFVVHNRFDASARAALTGQLEEPDRTDLTLVSLQVARVVVSGASADEINARLESLYQQRTSYLVACAGTLLNEEIDGIVRWVDRLDLSEGAEGGPLVDKCRQFVHLLGFGAAKAGLDVDASAVFRGAVARDLFEAGQRKEGRRFDLPFPRCYLPRMEEVRDPDLEAALAERAALAAPSRHVEADRPKPKTKHARAPPVKLTRSKKKQAAEVPEAIREARAAALDACANCREVCGDHVLCGGMGHMICRLCARRLKKKKLGCPCCSGTLPNPK